MRLEERNKWCTFKEWTCDLTRDLDQMAGLDERLHYLQEDRFRFMLKNPPDYLIRVPGGTVGNIRLDKEGKIERIFIDRYGVVQSYPKDLEERIKKYIGERIWV